MTATKSTNTANTTKIGFKLNGKPVTVTTDPLRRLIDVLREDFDLKGVKEGCSEGECGACSVLFNGRMVTSCIIPIGAADGQEIMTIEGIPQTEKGKAIIEVPIACMFSQYPEKSLLNGVFISQAGDTLSRFSKVKANSIITKTLPPQSNVKIVVCDSIRTEYGCSSMTVDLAPGTKTTTDTLFLQDNIKPNMVPASTEFDAASSLKFFILDNGSGVNASRITAIMNSDTLKTVFDDYTLTIPNKCKKECNLFIKAEDYANNKAPEVYWKLSTEKSVTTIKGPFSTTEGNK